jgi:hypothetical protein
LRLLLPNCSACILYETGMVILLCEWSNGLIK